MPLSPRLWGSGSSPTRIEATVSTFYVAWSASSGGPEAGHHGSTLSSTALIVQVSIHRHGVVHILFGVVPLASGMQGILVTPILIKVACAGKDLWGAAAHGIKGPETIRFHQCLLGLLLASGSRVSGS